MEIDEKSTVWKFPEVASHFLYAVVVSAGITLYLSPSMPKYYTAHLVFAALLLVDVLMKGVRPFEAGRIVGWALPLIGLLCIPLFRAFVLSDNGSLEYVYDPIVAFIPLVMLYRYARHLPERFVKISIVTILIFPGIVHLMYMIFDIFDMLLLHYHERLYSDRIRIFEYLKDAPRVGRRYVSLALCQMIIGGVVMAQVFTRFQLRSAGWIVATAALLSLALLDARSAYLSLIGGVALVLVTIGRFFPRFSFDLRAAKQLKIRIAISLIVVSAMVIAYNSGRSRWDAASYSAELAVHDVIRSGVPLKDRPFVDQSVWNTKIDDIEVCINEQHFRCAVDQSMYLRVAWMVSGARSIFEHPLGMGYSSSYMGRLWGVEGVPGKNQTVDNFIIELGVSFGLLGIAMYAIFGLRLGYSLRKSIRYGVSPPHAFLLAGLVGLLYTCMARSLIDVWSEGLWGYLFGLFGLYAGLQDRRLDNQSVSLANP